MPNKFDSRQSIHKTLLKSVFTTLPAAGQEVDNILDSMDEELTMPLRMLATVPVDRTLNIENIEVSNSETDRRRTVPPISGTLPSFSSGTVEFPPSSGGTITVTPGTNETLTLTSNNYIKVGVHIDSTGDIKLSFGVEGASEAAATTPGSLSGTFFIGYVVIFNNAGTIANVEDGDVVQFSGGGGAGSGAGVGGINYIEDNPGFELDTAGYAAYADAAGTEPVNGTGGSPTVTITRTTTAAEILRDTASGEITKDAANRQGEGISYDFTIDRADFNRRLPITFDWMTSANYVHNDMGIYIYDIDNGVLIKPSFINLPAHPTIGTPITTYFNATDSANYRLIWHVQSTSALGYSCIIDNVKVGPDAVVQAAPIGEWTSWVPTNVQGFTVDGTTGTGTWTGLEYKRVGSTMLIKGRFVLADNQASEAQLELPNSLTLSNVETSPIIVGRYVRDIAVAAGAGGSLLATSGDTYLNFGRLHTSTADHLVPANGTDISIDNEDVSIDAVVTIAEWVGSSVGLANSRVLFAYNSDTGTGAGTDTTSFAYGPGGALIQAITGQRTRRVRFLTPIQPTDKIDLQFSEDQINWVTPPFHESDGSIIPAYSYNGTTDNGASFKHVSGSNTDLDIVFSATRYSANDWTAVQNSYWRVSKSSNPLSVASKVPNSFIRMDTANGHGNAGGTRIRRWTNITDSFGSAITYTSSVGDGDTFTINETGVYAMSYTDDDAAGGPGIFGISLNSTQLTTALQSITLADRLILAECGSPFLSNLSCTVFLNAGDVIRCHTDAKPDSTVNANFIITQCFSAE